MERNYKYIFRLQKSTEIFYEYVGLKRKSYVGRPTKEYVDHRLILMRKKGRLLHKIFQDNGD